MFFILLLLFLDKDNKQKDVEEEQNNVPAIILAKVLEERVKERLTHRHCYSCSCNSKNNDSHTNQKGCSLSQNDLSDKRVRSTLTKSSKKSCSTKSSESLTSESDLPPCFDQSMSITDSFDNGMKLSARSRVCSVRLQEGSNNILLDNAGGSYTGPILYKSRSSSGEYEEPLVHSQKMMDRNEHSTRILISDEEIV